MLLLPLWAINALLFLGLWFLLLPVPLVLGLRWEFYALGLLGAGVMAWSVRRRYRMTIIERSKDVVVLRPERVRGAGKV